jgi:hypothetical protein
MFRRTLLLPSSLSSAAVGYQRFGGLSCLHLQGETTTSVYDHVHRYDFDNQHIHHEVTVPKVQIIGKYSVSGRILLLPITGNGDINITLGN